MKVGETIYIEGCELIVTQVRVDRTASGTTAMIQLADPILYTKEQMEYEVKKEYFAKHRAMIDSINKTFGSEGDT